jgi:hypothetical protein
MLPTLRNACYKPKTPTPRQVQEELHFALNCLTPSFSICTKEDGGRDFLSFKERESWEPLPEGPTRVLGIWTDGVLGPCRVLFFPPQIKESKACLSSQKEESFCPPHGGIQIHYQISPGLLWDTGGFGGEAETTRLSSSIEVPGSWTNICEFQFEGSPLGTTSLTEIRLNSNGLLHFLLYTAKGNVILRLETYLI